MEHGVEWTPGIGDPTVMGWLTVVAYFVAAWLCLRAFKSEKRGPDRPYRQAIPALVRVLKKHWPSPPAPARRAALWLVLAFVLGALGVNKQLDLQTLFTQTLRDLARAQGWYERRRPYQVAFIAAVGLTSAAGTALLAFAMRRVLHRIWLGLLGLGLLAGFVLIRAASIHQVDVMLKRGVVRLNWVLELGAIGVIALSALRQRAGPPAAVHAYAPLDARGQGPAASPQLPDRDGKT
jgi:hypothetical protein